MRTCARARSKSKSGFFTWVFCLPLLVGPLPPVLAQVWDGGNATSNWHDAGNWNPDGVPGNTTTATLDASLAAATTVNLGANVRFAGNNGINGLTIADGFVLDTNGFLLVVDDNASGGATDISGLGSSLIVRPLASSPTDNSLFTDLLVVRASGTLFMDGGIAKIDNLAEIRSNSLVQGHGQLTFGDPTSSGILLDNKGEIRVTPLPFGGGTLVLALGPNAPAGTTLGLSGSTGGGILTANDASSLTAVRLVVDGATEDFEGTLNIGGFDTAEFVDDLLITGGIINFNGDLATATLTGTGSVSSIGGTLNVNSGTARIETVTVLGISSEVLVAPNSTLIFANSITADSSGIIDVGVGSTIQFDGFGNFIEADAVQLLFNDDSQLIVHSYTNIDAGATTNFDWDGAAENADTIVDGPGAKLIVKGDDIDAAANGHNGDLSILNAGQIEVSINSATGMFVKHGLLILSSQATSLSSRLDILNGTSASFDGTVVASGDGVSIINGDDNQFQNAVNVTVEPGATLRIKNSSVAGGAWGVGDGILQNSVSMTVDSSTSMFFDKVDLDGDDGEATLFLNDPLTLSVDAISEDSSNVFGQFYGIATTTQIDIMTNGELNVALSNPSDHWTLGENAILNLTANMGGSEHVSGSDVRIDGTANVIAGESQWTARMTIGNSPATVTIAAGSSLKLDGGGLLNPNRIEGGNVLGTGQLRAGNSRSLQGYGRIDADINFASPNNSLLAADQNELRVNGNVIDVGKIGTANAGGTLRFGQPFVTGVADQLSLNGGTVTGAALNNNGGLTRGFGTITAQQFIQNAPGIISGEGGTLTIDVAAAQLQVTQGTLNATTGNLVLMDPLSGPFTGVANVGPQRSMSFPNGWTLSAATGQLNLTGGNTFPNQASVLGDTTIQGNATVTVTREGAFRDKVRFDALATVNIPTPMDVLRLMGDAEIPFNGAQTAIIQGNGLLSNEAASTLVVDTNVAVNVNLRNAGSLALERMATGSVLLRKGFSQPGSGSLEIELQGTLSGQADLLVVAEAAQLAGTLEVSLLGGFSPMLGDSFQIISAAGGVTGMFNHELLPLLPGLIGFDVVYNPLDVRLEVVSFPDFNMDGLLDCVDVDSLVGVIAAGSNLPAFDLTGDGNVNATDLTQWLANAGAINLASGNSYLPGDANLDGVVDGSDFGIWNSHKFTSVAAWCSGDFNADGVVDGSDFGIWNANKFNASDGTSVVPEPSLGLLAAILMIRKGVRSLSEFSAGS
jgi:hypothetical protein